MNPSSPWNASGQTPPDLVPYDYLPANTGIRNLGTLTSVRYFIDTTGAPARAAAPDGGRHGQPRPAQILAEGIEDMQIAYACDTQPGGNPDGSLSEGTDAASRLADEWTYNEAGDVPPAHLRYPQRHPHHPARPLADRRHRACSAPSGSGSASNSFKPAVEDGVAGAPDAFRHRTLTTTVYPRN